MNSWQPNESPTSIGKVMFVVLFSAAIMIGWQYFFDKPVSKKQNDITAETSQKNQKTSDDVEIKQENIKIISLEDSLLANKKQTIDFSNDFILGRVNLTGATIDHLILNKYKNKINSDESVVLLAPHDTKNAKYVLFGWLANDSDIDLPNIKTQWQSNNSDIFSAEGITLSWKNKQKIEFFIKLRLDKKYLLSVEKYIINNSAINLDLTPFTSIKRDITEPIKDGGVYQGPMAIKDNAVQEVAYSKIEKNNIDYDQKNVNCPPRQYNWAGFSDKYWLSAIIFECSSIKKISFINKNVGDRKYIESRIIENSLNITAGAKSAITKNFVYLGAKDIFTLDDYIDKYNIRLFDKTIDFGIFYFLTKPILLTLRFIHNFIPNYGLAIIMLTILIRVAMLPLGNKSYRMMNRMKEMQPKMDELKAKFGTDKIAMNKGMIELYKKEKVNPFATFIPILIQIPIFFALYKVLYISIEIRQSPFIWLQDLSAPDPTSLFNLFGFLPFDMPSFLQVGILPIFVGLTMWLQQIMSYSGPTNEYTKIMKYMPLFFTFLFASFPSGLMIYWSINNLFSIVNQWFVTKKLK